jgi:hypothetical protein
MNPEWNDLTDFIMDMNPLMQMDERDQNKMIKPILSGKLNIILLRCLYKLTTHLPTEAYYSEGSPNR